MKQPGTPLYDPMKFRGMHPAENTHLKQGVEHGK